LLNNSNRGSQRCDYDENNRLLAVRESPVRYSWSQSYGYDQYRSRYGSATTTAILPIAVNEPGALSEFRAANNMMEGIKDDAAGNRAAYGSFALNYDGENRNTVVTAESGTCVTYVYDGDGCRVKKANGGTVATAIYVYDAMRRMAAEYSVLGTSMSGNIGTIADLTGAVAKNCDNLPSGRMLNSSQNGRANLNFPDYPDIPFALDSLTPQQFTGKERDAETGLDFFLARYYSPAEGRFITPDWASRPEPVPYAKLDNPQTLNLYAYVGNNPLTRIDADGHGWPEFLTKLKNVGIAMGITKADDPKIAIYDHKPPSPSKELQNNILDNYHPGGGKDTTKDIAGRVYNETRGMKDGKGANEPLSDARAKIAHSRINAIEEYGDRVDKRAGMMGPRNDGSNDYKSTLEVTRQAVIDQVGGIDPTNGAYHYNMRTGTADVSDFLGKRLHSSSGPYISPTQFKVINTYGD
jgi:RHS repeat-associated protein